MSSDKYFEKGVAIDIPKRVLGILWNSGNDELYFIAKLNFSSCIQNGRRLEPGLTIHDIPEKIPLNGMYDPLGLLTPFAVKGKMIMRKLWILKIDWDDVLPTEIRNECIMFFREMLQIPSMKFKRCVKPEGAIGNPLLIILSDASEEAFGCCVYVSWKINDESYKSALLISKGKIDPLKIVSIIRLELSAAVLANYLHGKAHLGIEADVAKLRSHLLIIGVRRLVRSIKYNCVWCKRMYGITEMQAVTPLPIERLKPAPPWFYTGINLFGPIKIRGEVNKRSFGEAHGIIYTCLLTLVIYLIYL